MEKIGKENKMRNVREKFPGYMKRRVKMKIKNLIEKTNETEHNSFLLNQANEDYNAMKSLLQVLKRYENELRQIATELKSCEDIRKLNLIVAHYNSVMNQYNECNTRIEHLVVSETLRKIKEQKGW